jgi:hypothetical protein
MSSVAHRCARIGPSPTVARPVTKESNRRSWQISDPRAPHRSPLALTDCVFMGTPNFWQQRFRLNCRGRFCCPTTFDAWLSLSKALLFPASLRLPRRRDRARQRAGSFPVLIPLRPESCRRAPAIRTTSPSPLGFTHMPPQTAGAMVKRDSQVPGGSDLTALLTRSPRVC